MFRIPGVALALLGMVLGILTAVDEISIRSFMMQSPLSLGMALVGVFFCVSALALNSLTLLMKNQL